MKPLLAAALLLSSPLALAARPPRPPPDAAARLVGGALADGVAYARAAELADGIGARLAGSPGADAAVAWAVRAFERDEIRAWTEPVRVPRWSRGEERAEVIATPPARNQPLAVTALGNSPPTPPGGLVAEVVEAGSLDALRALGEAVRGKIVLFQHPMPASGTYGEHSKLRNRGPGEAARLGAAGVLVRSLATASLRTPHTGTTRFPPGVTPIPAAAVSTEDAELLRRLAARGAPRVRLVLGCSPGDPPSVESANVVAEIRGRERPGEVVVLAAHLDSWDLGTGALDDATGVAMVMEAMRQVARLGVAPRRTLRAVLYMNEENGLDGAVAYAERHAAELPRHVAAVEADFGTGRPLGFGVDAGEGGIAAVARLAAPLAGIGAAAVAAGEGGADLGPLRYQGVPVLGLDQEEAGYFDVHHSPADTLDRVDARALAQGAAAMAVIGWSLAETGETLPRPPPPSTPPWWLPEPEQPPQAPR